MPYELKGNCVVKKETGETVKCHKTHAEALAHLRALEINVEDAKATPIESPIGEQVDVDAAAGINTAINFGGAIKALPGGKVGGYLITFGGTDLEGEYFDKQTDYGETDILPVMYHHGLDRTLKRRRIGTALLTEDEIGIWAEAQLQLRDEYERKIYELAEAGKLGWSSGTASHVVEYQPQASNTRIAQWFFTEASLTPAPAELNNGVMTLKTYMDKYINEPSPKDATGTETVSREAMEEKTEIKIEPKQENKTEKLGEKTMELTPELSELLKSAVKESADAAVKAFQEAAPAPKAQTNISVVTDEGDQPWKNDGEFFMAVKAAALNPSQIDPRLLAIKAPQGLNEGIPSQGGFLVPQTVAPGIIEKMYTTGNLLATINPVPVAGNNMTFNVIDETSRADGSRMGGVQGYWLEEAGSKTKSKPKFRQLDLKLHKVAALAYATDELLEDAGALQNWLATNVPNELRFMVEDAIFEGDGVGKPLGLRTSPAMISVLRRTLLTIDAIDVATMWSRRYAGVNDYVWLVNPSTFPAFLAMTVGQIPIWLPSGNIVGQPYASTLFGRPLIETEYSETLGTVGDIVLFSPSQYQAISKGGVQQASSIHVAFTTDETCFRFVYRFDGAPVWYSALTGYDGVTYSPYVQLATSTS